MSTAGRFCNAAYLCRVSTEAVVIPRFRSVPRPSGPGPGPSLRQAGLTRASKHSAVAALSPPGQTRTLGWLDATNTVGTNFIQRLKKKKKVLSSTFHFSQLNSCAPVNTGR